MGLWDRGLSSVESIKVRLAGLKFDDIVNYHKEINDANNQLKKWDELIQQVSGEIFKGKPDHHIHRAEEYRELEEGEFFKIAEYFLSKCMFDNYSFLNNDAEHKKHFQVAEDIGTFGKGLFDFVTLILDNYLLAAKHSFHFSILSIHTDHYFRKIYYHLCDEDKRSQIISTMADMFEKKRSPETGIVPNKISHTWLELAGLDLACMLCKANAKSIAKMTGIFMRGRSQKQADEFLSGESGLSTPLMMWIKRSDELYEALQQECSEHAEIVMRYARGSNTLPDYLMCYHR